MEKESLDIVETALKGHSSDLELHFSQVCLTSEKQVEVTIKDGLSLPGTKTQVLTHPHNV